jgi:hypothetical protein
VLKPQDSVIGIADDDDIARRVQKIRRRVMPPRGSRT